MIGQSLGRYRIDAKLGEGGMGVVYKALDTQLGRAVAIKVLPPDTVADPERKRRFIQEAKSASALNHPAIVTVHDFAEVDGQAFIVMEYLPGATLDQIIPPNGLAPHVVLKYAAQMADALAKAHEAGILHRDLKPSNVLITEDGRAKILDFGLAKLLEIESSHSQTTMAATDAGVIVGTAAYMSPEQAEGKKLDARSDIFSFGSVLYEMVTGRKAFRGDSRLSVLHKVVTEQPVSPSQISGAISVDLEKAILRCLRKDPSRRFQSMADLRVALEDLSSESDAAVVPQRKRTLPMWLPIVAAVVVIAGIGYVIVQQRSPAPAAAEPLHAVPITALQGALRMPSLSPDGAHVVFRWTGPTDTNSDLFVQQIGVAAPPLRLTTAPEFDYAPSWSPDGRAIAFLRGGASGGMGEVRVVPPLGGPERKVAEINNQMTLYRPPSLAWCPDSSCLVVTDSMSGERSSVIVSVAIDTGEKRQLSFGSTPVLDLDPMVSPDGRWLVFRRDTTPFTGDYYRLPMKGRESTGGDPVRLTTSRSAGDSPAKAAWTPDSRAIIFSARGALWRADAIEPGTRERLPYVGEDGRDPSLAAVRDGSVRLVYVRSTIDSNVWRLTLPAAGVATTAAPEPVARSPRFEHLPNVSPDGKRVLFLSNRSGDSEFWVADTDGGNMLQLTTLASLPGFGRWSPDASMIAFHSDPQGRPDILVMPTQGGAPRTVTANFEGGAYPSFSRDGRWIYFANNKDQRVWKIAPTGGEPVPVTSNAGSVSIESVDGRDLYYLDTATPAGLWRQPLSGGAPTKLLDGVINSCFDVIAGGIYYLDRDRATPATTNLINQSRTARLQYYDFATRRSTLIAPELGAVNLGLSASSDGRTLFFARTDASADELMLVEKFK